MANKSPIDPDVFEACAAAESRAAELLDELDEILAVTLTLRAEKARIEAEIAKLGDAFRSATSGELPSQTEQRRRIEAETLSTSLASLYVAVDRIHSSLERGEVLSAIKDVIINQIGSEEFAIFECEGPRLTLVASSGAHGGRAPHPAILDEVLSTGAVFIRSRSQNRPQEPKDAPAACIPLKVGNRVVGLIAIHSLFSHKDHFEPLDHELASILSTHAGIALFASALYMRFKKEEGRR